MRTALDNPGAALGAKYLVTELHAGLPNELLLGAPCIYVAASDASVASKAWAVATGGYVCDGAADEVQINLAIARLLATGGKVMLSEGLFTVDTSGHAILGNETCVYIGVDSVTLEGQGAATIIKMADEQVCNVIGVEAHNVHISNLLVDGNRANQTYAGLTMNGIGVDNAYDYCVIRGCFLLRAWHNGVSIGQCEGCIAQGNICIDNHDTGIMTWGSNGCVIDGNTCFDNLIGLGCFHDSTRCVFSNNIIETCTEAGIYVNGTDGSHKPSHNTFEGGSVSDITTAYPAIYFDANIGDYNKVIGITVVPGSSGVHAIEFEGSYGIIANNIISTFSAADAVGILVRSGATYVIVEGNILDRTVQSAYCIQIEGHHCQVRGNVCYGAWRGVYVAATVESTRIRNNTFAGLSGESIVDDSGIDTVMEGNEGSTSDGYIADPGDGNAIPVTRSGRVPLISGAANGGETRTLADAAVAGLTLDLQFKTDGGKDIAVTAASAINQNGDTVMTFSDAGEHIRLFSIEDGGDKEWRVVCNDGVVLS